MATHAYEPIPAGPGQAPGQAPSRARTARLTTFWVVVALIGVTPKPIRKAIYQGGKSATIGTVALAYRVGHAIETKGASRVKGAVVSDSCAKCEKCAEDLEEVWSNYGTATPSAAPTETRYWDLYWTDGAIPRFNAIKESYVWTTSNEWEDVHASVLVDTYGYARGVDIDLNGSVVYFTIDGCIGRVHREGYDPGVLVCYENVTDTQMEGLAVYNYRPTTIPTSAPTCAVQGETLNFCSEPDFQGWAVQSGRMVFGAAEAGRRCLAKSSSRDYVTIYGSHYNYTDDDLDIHAEIAFSSDELTSHRDSVVAFRIADSRRRRSRWRRPSRPPRRRRGRRSAASASGRRRRRRPTSPRPSPRSAASASPRTRRRSPRTRRTRRRGPRKETNARRTTTTAAAKRRRRRRVRQKEMSGSRPRRPNRRNGTGACPWDPIHRPPSKNYVEPTLDARFFGRRAGAGRPRVRWRAGAGCPWARGRPLRRARRARRAAQSLAASFFSASGPKRLRTTQYQNTAQKPRNASQMLTE